jgi:NADPH-dependent glutamate synthase beta subunit-like oxidoreductase
MTGLLGEISVRGQCDMTDRKNGSGDRFDIAVIGGGQAGLAMGYFLREQAVGSRPRSL